MKFLLLLALALACASKPKPSLCEGATETVKLAASDAKKIQGNVSQFLSDAEIRREPSPDGMGSVWRFKNMPEDSVYHKIGLRSGDVVLKTNLGEQKSSLNLISDLSGIGSGTTNCLYVQSRENVSKVIKIEILKD